MLTVVNRHKIATTFVTISLVAVIIVIVRVTVFTQSQGKRLSLPTSDIPLFIGFTYGYPMLLQTLQRYTELNWPNIVIIDNSDKKIAFRERDTLQTKYGAKVIRTSAKLHFPQIQQTFQYYAHEFGVEWYFWTHSDAYPFPQDPNTFYKQAFNLAVKSFETPSVAMVFYGYDFLSAVRLSAIDKIGWDVYVHQYGSDCDTYARTRLHGGQIKEAGLGPILNMKLLIPDEVKHKIKTSNNYTANLQTIREYEHGYDYSWRTKHPESAMQQADFIGNSKLSEASDAYLRKKWNFTASFDCDLKKYTLIFDHKIPDQKSWISSLLTTKN